ECRGLVSPPAGASGLSRACDDPVRRALRAAGILSGPIALCRAPATLCLDRSGERRAMARIKILDRADMNAEQGRVYDAAKAANGPLGGPYYAYIHLPKLFETAQALRSALAAGPLSRREAQIVNLVVARYWGARY